MEDSSGSNGSNSQRQTLKRLGEIKNNELYAKVGEHCVQDSDGATVRGVVNLIKCHVCGSNRWNDGTRCRKPTGLKQNGGICGAYPSARFNADDESRL